MVDNVKNGLFQICFILLTFMSDSLSQNDFLGLNKPFFNPSSEAVIHALIGSVGYLTCEVYNLNNLSVSWVRGRDSHILTVDRETFISDNRFISMDKKEKMYNIITLAIHEIQIQDQGNYECQVSSQPKISRHIELIVLEPEVSILGNPDIYVKEGSEVSLKCTIKNIVGDIPFVTWLFNDQVG
jgi:hypothetical protein